jgi:quercetin dioxygenase-like cupin family protein
MKRSRLFQIAATIALCSQAPAGFGQQSEANAPTNVVKLNGVNVTRMPWEILEVPQIKAKIPVKILPTDFGTDHGTGMQVFMVKYVAGFMNTWHTHPNAHGMYVLEGVLKTHQGEYEAGSFVWFPEGGWMEHGATAKSDVTILFITDKPFGISYPSDSNQPYPMNK